MHSKRSEDERIINEFKKSLIKHGIIAEKIILFGSHARGTAEKYSDIDLVVVSRDFEKMGFKQRCEVLGRAVADIMEPIEPMAYAPEELDNLPETNLINTIISKAPG